ncbi:MAG: hypothetical protein K0V04_19095 [Deltaproteobacteria bacterium]|nr:hypothetical protein [Deltaproteobacteria bacterium]
MAFALHWLDTPVPATWPAKALRLSQLSAAGLPVPAGLVTVAEPAVLDDPAVREAITGLLARGPVVVRSALHGEDDQEGSAAGLGRSTLDCHDLAAVGDALEQLVAQREDPWLQAYREDADGSAVDAVIVQQQIEREALLVLATPPGGLTEVEVHTAEGEALAHGVSPAFAGALSTWEHPARAEVQALVDRAVQALPPAEHGHDLEVVVDRDHHPHLVQARPLVAPLHPGWPAFLDAVIAGQQLGSLRGVLTLDAEHNPAPLSPAHAWLMGWLASQRPAAGEPTVLAGWLYVRTLPRDLARGRAGSPSTTTPTAATVVAQLHGTTLPQARARLEQVQRSLDDATASAIADVRTRAEEAFLSMIDTYVGVLVPARTRARRALAVLVADPSQPLSTRGREAYLDVLPATWDIASKSLAELGAAPGVSAGAIDPLPRDEATAATLLGEWDDHLFALGLAPLRAWFLAAGRSLGLGDEVFMLTAPEVDRALRHGSATIGARIASRRETLAAQSTLRPPLRIVEGRPVSFGRRARLRGIPLGETFTGPLAPRADLAALLADPPEPDTIVVLPSLTAPAAVALRQLGIRAVCCEHGGALSHAALMVRELGLSALVGCRGCTELPAGLRARLDTTAGRLLLDPSEATVPESSGTPPRANLGDHRD